MNIELIDQALKSKSNRLKFPAELEEAFKKHSIEKLNSLVKGYGFYFLFLIWFLLAFAPFFNDMSSIGSYKSLVTTVTVSFILIIAAANLEISRPHIFKVLVVVLTVAILSVFVWTTTMPIELGKRMISVSALIAIIALFVIFRYNIWYAVLTFILSIGLFFLYCIYTSYPITWVYFRFNFFIPFIAGLLLGYFNEREERQSYLKNLKLNCLYEKVELLSKVDELTQIYNRRFFNEALKAEWSRAQRSGKSITIALADIDFFKQYNDHYGHIVGDSALKKVALVLKNSLKRPSDIVCRYGGEEFVFILFDTQHNDTKIILERIQKNIQEANIAHEASEFGRISISLGVFCAIPDQDDSYEKALLLADDALYLAKAEGRNRYIFSKANS